LQKLHFSFFRNLFFKNIPINYTVKHNLSLYRSFLFHAPGTAAQIRRKLKVSDSLRASCTCSTPALFIEPNTEETPRLSFHSIEGLRFVMFFFLIDPPKNGKYIVLLNLI
jgi:hypothetical protein